MNQPRTEYMLTDLKAGNTESCSKDIHKWLEKNSETYDYDLDV